MGRCEFSNSRELRSSSGLEALAVSVFQSVLTSFLFSIIFVDYFLTFGVGTSGICSSNCGKAQLFFPTFYNDAWFTATNTDIGIGSIHSLPD